LDWDVHHGDGTEGIFFENGQVLNISTHQYGNGFYPQTGHINDIGEGEGENNNINVPFEVTPEKGTYSDVDFIKVFKELIVPVIKQYDPELILVSAGFDALNDDTLGDLEVSPNGFGWLTKLIMENSNGKIVMALEGVLKIMIKI
jgi:acetoin utilization deacetylase AcuC-like enzyme